MDIDALERTLGLMPYCQFCENIRKVNGCEGCNGFINPLRPSENEPPTKFKPIYKIRKENKKMVITIIGSLKREREMQEVKKYFERFGHKVNCPGELELQSKPLIEIQKEWYEKIEEADLIVAIPKAVLLDGHGKSNFVLEFGESTSYEMAIASKLKKKIIFA